VVVGVIPVIARLKIISETTTTISEQAKTRFCPYILLDKPFVVLYY